MDRVAEAKKLYTEEEWARIKELMDTTNLGLDGAIEMFGVETTSPHGDRFMIGVLPRAKP